MMVEGQNDTLQKDENAGSRHSFEEKYLGRDDLLGVRRGQEKQSCHGIKGYQVLAEQLKKTALENTSFLV
jgi:hypothetical protein